MKEKNTKAIAVGEAAINYLDSIKSDLEKNSTFENINVNKDVDKEFVRKLLDGIEILYIIYDSSNKDTNNIVKAISFMAVERKVLCIGLDMNTKENKEDLGLDTEFKINKYNLNSILYMINMISESIDEETLMYIDLSDLKEIFQGSAAVCFTAEEFETDKTAEEVATSLKEDFYKSEGELSLKKGLLLYETSQHMENNLLMYLNEVKEKLVELEETNIDIIFSYNEKDVDSNSVKIAYIRN